MLSVLVALDKTPGNFGFRNVWFQELLLVG